MVCLYACHGLSGGLQSVFGTSRERQRPGPYPRMTPHPNRLQPRPIRARNEVTGPAAATSPHPSHLQSCLILKRRTARRLSPETNRGRSNHTQPTNCSRGGLSSLSHRGLCSCRKSLKFQQPVIEVATMKTNSVKPDLLNCSRSMNRFAVARKNRHDPCGGIVARPIVDLFRRLYGIPDALKGLLPSGFCQYSRKCIRTGEKPRFKLMKRQERNKVLVRKVFRKSRFHMLYTLDGV